MAHPGTLSRGSSRGLAYGYLVAQHLKLQTLLPAFHASSSAVGLLVPAQAHTLNSRESLSLELPVGHGELAFPNFLNWTMFCKYALGYTRAALPWLARNTRLIFPNGKKD